MRYPNLFLFFPLCTHLQDIDNSVFAGSCVLPPSFTLSVKTNLNINQSRVEIFSQSPLNCPFSQSGNCYKYNFVDIRQLCLWGLFQCLLESVSRLTLTSVGCQEQNNEDILHMAYIFFCESCPPENK